MANLAFIRSATCFESWDYYERKTDVWIFGDVEGYDWLRQKFLDAMGATENCRLSILQKHLTSMKSVILPAESTGDQSPRFKVIERLIPDPATPNLELVFFGNASGYQYLADKLATLVKKHSGNPSEHVHLDDLVDPNMVPRSVSLNLRGPVHKWEREKFGEYAGLVYSISPDLLPSELDYRLHQKVEYEEITVAESEFLRI